MKTKSSRHANPSAAILLARIDRKCNAMDKNLKRTMKTLADDFTRILRQNDTLRGKVETLEGMLRAREAKQLREADTFMSAPLAALCPAVYKDIV